jgi:glycine dehydrogenase subunit 1
MRYLPKSPTDREAMLRTVGVDSINALFSSIPEKYRLQKDLALPPAMSEQEIVEHFQQAAAENASGHASFLGAGVYRHYRPVVIDAMVQRGEFLTSYTPYQAEIAQGTLQAIFEFQTMVCELTGMEVANASMYDGATATTEAVMMATRLTGRDHVLLARTVHPEYREVLSTYAQHQRLRQQEIGHDEDGRIDRKQLEAAITDQTACVLIQSPNFFGVIEDVEEVAALAHARGALLVVAIAEALSLGVVRPPAEADIVAMEAQSFGIPPSYGGPYCGVLACKEQFVRQMPGRLVGETTDKHGRRGYVLTLSTREQHIRREKATSNICTNQALMALMACIYMTIYGKQGLRELAEQNLAKAQYAAQTLAATPGSKLLFASAPHFNEFVLQTKEAPESVGRKLLEQKVLGGLPLAKWYPELGNATLWCATEMNTRGQIDTAAQALSR